jgi:hypothetical protein
VETRHAGRLLARRVGVGYRDVMKTPLLSIVALAVLLITGIANAEGAKPLPPIKAVTYNAHGFLLVDGKPFFPILLYEAPHDDASLAKMSEMGFNVLTAPTAEEANKLPAKGFYGAIHVAKKVENASGVVIVFSTDSPAMTYKENLVEKTKEANAKSSALCPDRPIMNAIGYWLGEPEGVEKNVLPGKDKYEDLVAGIEIAAPYLYPVPYQPVGTVGDAVERARIATKGSMPLLPILQLFRWDAKTRYANPEELRCMVYLSLIEGATGIGYYTYGSVKDPAKADPEAIKTWESMKDLNKEVSELGAALIEGEESKVQASKNESGVKWRAVEHGGSGTLLIANPGAKAATITLDLPGGKKLTASLKPLEAKFEKFAVEK